MQCLAKSRISRLRFAFHEVSEMPARIPTGLPFAAVAAEASMFICEPLLPLSELYTIASESFHFLTDTPFDFAVLCLFTSFIRDSISSQLPQRNLYITTYNLHND